MCILDTLLTLRMIDRRCFWAKVLAISYGKKKPDKSDAGQILCFAVNKGLDESISSLHTSCKTWHGLKSDPSAQASAAGATSD